MSVEVVARGEGVDYRSRQKKINSLLEKLSTTKGMVRYDVFWREGLSTIFNIELD